MYPLRILVALTLPGLALAACAPLPRDRGVGEVGRLVAERSGHRLSAVDADTERLVEDLFATPLTADHAVQVALVNNPEIRATYARLGLAAAEVYDAGRLSNPRLGAAVMVPDGSGAANQVTFGLTQSFTDLLLLPARRRLAQGEFDQAQEEGGAAILDLAADVEAAYYRLVGARQVAAMRATVAQAAQVAADLAQRFFAAGNLNARELALAQAAGSQARLDAMRANAETVAARNGLNRLMGLRAGDGRWAVTAQLPAPLDEEDDYDTLLDLARRSRLDLAAKRRAVARLADSLGVARHFRSVGAIEVGVETERETDRSRITGPNLSVELPLFNTGAGKVARAEALLHQGEAELQALALAVGNGVHLAHEQVLAARAVVEEYRRALIPEREAVVRHTQEEVNYMLTGQFELLVVQQQEYDAYQGYLEAVRDYWLARTELTHQVGARLPSQARAGAPALGPIILPEAPPAMHHGHAGGAADGMDHPGHDSDRRRDLDAPAPPPTPSPTGDPP